MAYGYNTGYNYNPYAVSRRRSRSTMSRAMRSIREANSSNSSIDFAFKINYVFTASYDSTTKMGVAAINAYDVLLKSENFRNMMKNWDEVKLNGVTARLNVTDALVSLGSVANVKSINVITGWDKTGLSKNDVNFYEGLSTNSGVILEEDFDTTNALSYVNTIGPRVGQGYGAKKGLLNTYQRFSRYESCWPTTMEQKGCYIPTANFNEYNSGIDSNTGLTQISGDYSGQNVNAQLAQPNPCIPFENSSIKWKPTLLVGVFSTTVGRNAQPDIPNPQYQIWSNNNPTETVQDAHNILPPNDADAQTVYNTITKYIGAVGQDYNAFATKYANLFTAMGLGSTVPDNTNVIIGGQTKTALEWRQAIATAVDTNTINWQTANNPNQRTIPNPNQGQTTTQVVQYGDVTPIVFNAEFTIPVTFKGQKGDM